MKTFLHCRHIKEDGIPCGSPPLRGERYCYFHLRYKGRPLRRNRHRFGGLYFRPGMAFSLKALRGNMKQVERVLASGTCPDPERVRMIRHALQIAISALRHTEEEGDIGGPESRPQPLTSSNKSNKRHILR